MSWEYEGLFDVELNDEPRLWRTEPVEGTVGRMQYRTKTIKAGPRLEVEIYPVWPREIQRKARAARRNITPVRMAEINKRNAENYLVQLADANFSDEDIHLTLTYAGSAPSFEQMQKDVRNFFGRLKRFRRRNGMPELKYIYSIEDAEDGEKKRIHSHMLLSGPGGKMDLNRYRAEVERIWAKGYANADRLQPNENGLEQITRYLTKQQRNRRRWCPSKNLKKPRVRVSNTKVSNARVKKIARTWENDAKEILEKIYPEYILAPDRARAYTSDLLPGVYIRAVMRRRGG